MASGSFNVTTSNKYISGKVTWSSTTNTAGNYSDVTATLRLSRTNTGYKTWGDGTFTITIDGSSKSNSGSFEFTYNSNTFCVSHTKRVYHNSNGSKSITISVSGGLSRFSMSKQSGTAKLDTIPRASTISSFPNFTIGNSVAVSIKRASSSFTHTLSLYVGSTYIGEWTNVGTSKTLSFNSTHLSRLYGAISSSATVTLKCTTYNGSTKIGSTTSRTATASVARASTISTFGNFTIGNSISVSLSRALGAFTHTLMLYVGSTKVCEKTGVDTSTTITLTSSEQNTLYNAFKNAASGTVTLRCYTYHNGHQIRSYTTKNATASVPSSVVPTFSSLTASETVSAVSSLGAGYIQNLSRIKFTINGAAGAKYSTIKSYRITFNGVNYNSSTATTGAINKSGTLTATATITDSRGRTASKSIKVTLQPYSVPSLSKLTAIRCNSNGTANPLGQYVKITTSGSISSLSSKNTYSYTIRTKPRSSSTWTTKKTASPSGTSISISDVIGTYPITSSYDIEVSVSDKFNTSRSAGIIPTGEVTMSWGRKGIGAGKVWEKGAIDAADDVYIKGHRAIFFAESEEW